jgi:hypothetical protein
MYSDHTPLVKKAQKCHFVPNVKMQEKAKVDY